MIKCNFSQAHSFRRKAYTAQKMKFSIQDFFSKCDQIQSLQIWSFLLKKSLMENSIFCAVLLPCYERNVLRTNSFVLAQLTLLGLNL